MSPQTLVRVGMAALVASALPALTAGAQQDAPTPAEKKQRLKLPPALPNDEAIYGGEEVN
jgi:hypothetical protein